MIVRPDLVAGPGQIVFVGARHMLFNGLFVLSVDGQEDGGRHGNGSLYSLGMVVGHLGAQPGHMQHPDEVVLEEPGDGRDPHGGSVAKAVVGLWIVVVEPGTEFHAVAGKGIAPADGLHGVDKGFFQFLVGSVPARCHDGVRHRQGHDGIVRELRTLREKLELLGLDVV